MNDPFKAAEREMRKAGFDLDRIPRAEFDQHIWGEGILFFWCDKRRLPSALELTLDMLEEWDDPVSEEDAERVLGYLRNDSER
jgi:hypothetical protein